MLKVMGIVLVVVIAVVLLYASTRPDTFHVERTATVNAAPDKIFANINDLHAWEAWSPYMKLDPAMKMSYSGAATGTGAAYEWDGNSSVGAGRVTITDTTPPNKVTIKLDMLKPFATSNDVIFTLEPKGAATEVTWAMDAPNNLISKVMSVFINMDTMVGGQFEEGLANLKVVVEKAAVVSSPRPSP